MRISGCNGNGMLAICMFMLRDRCLFLMMKVCMSNEKSAELHAGGISMWDGEMIMSLTEPTGRHS